MPHDSGERTAAMRWLGDTYVETQKLRIAVENRARALGTTSTSSPDPLTGLAEQLRVTERALVEEMRRALAGHPVAPWLAAVRGVGPTLATKLLGRVGDIRRFETVSKLWRFAGYAVFPAPCGHCVRAARPDVRCPRCRGRGWIGRREWRTRGIPASYDVRLKTTLYQIGVSLLRCHSPYRTIYDRARAGYDAREAALPTRERWSAAHCHQASLRRMIKAFLAQLFVAWREAEGLPLPAREARPAGRSPYFMCASDVVMRDPSATRRHFTRRSVRSG